MYLKNKEGNRVALLIQVVWFLQTMKIVVTGSPRCTR